MNDVAYVRRRNRWRLPRAGPRTRLALAAVLVLLAALALERALAPGLLVIARREAEIRAIQTITEVVQREVAGRYRPEDVVHVRYEAGRPVFVQVNTPLIVQVQAGVQRAVQERLNALRSEPVRIPAGAVLGSELLAGRGPAIPVQVLPLGRVDIDVRSRFEAAGINQVRHSIDLVIRTGIRVAIPLYGDTVPVEVPVPLVDTVIPGEVPPWVVPWPQGPSAPGGASLPGTGTPLPGTGTASPGSGTP
ncbi:MAG: sporulation protein YunB [Bacillota bacterium]|nr:MAG: sporulation protein YunB [Bacillota bacterium]